MASNNINNNSNNNLIINNNNNETQTGQSARLADFYRGKSVFITGATGFVGKVCLIKILSSLSDVEKIYVIMRAKKGLSAQQRFKMMLQDEPFVSKIHSNSNTNKQFAAKNNDSKRENGDGSMKQLQENGNGKCRQEPETDGQKWQRIWEESRERLKKLDWSKVVAIDGDLSKPELGFNEDSKQLLWDKANIILNIAASVSFDAPLKQNLRDNYMGTKYMLQLAMNCKNLISFVHVSTFYTNSHVPHIEERVLEMERPCEKMADLIQFLPEKVCKTLENREFMENRPNTYIYTKAMTEDLVSSYEGRLPLSIVRPSIILPSIEDPVPGWVDNVNGPMGLGVLASLGILRTIDWNYDGVSDIIPCDYVSNCILVVAERTARLHQKKICVYNCSSSSLNPITWGQAFEVLRAESMKAPPYKMLRVPIKVPNYKRANPIAFRLIKWSELLFAYFIDLILTICGQKPLLVKLTRKLHHGYKLLKPFTVNQYTCDNDNLMAAFEQLNDQDKREFNFNVAKLNWQEAFACAYYGTRMALLKEDISNVPAALFKFRILMAVSLIFKCLFYSLIGAMLWSYVISRYISGPIPSIA